MRLQRIDFGTPLNGMSISVMRVTDKSNGLLHEQEFVEFFIKYGSQSLHYNLQEDEVRHLIKMLERAVSESGA
jgi:hypothetical protein